MNHPSNEELLDVAVNAAYLAGRRTLAYFNVGVAVETKADQTPVTRADREAEQVVRERIVRSFPTHSVVGEEHGTLQGDESYRWIIDPIDGTKSFIHGVPFYAVLIGVEVRGEPTIGVIYLPALDEMLWGATDMGCWWNGRRARVSDVSHLKQALLITSSITSCLARSDAYEKLAAATAIQRTWGDAYGYAMVATGRAEIMLDTHMHPWDCAPMLPILREAGGHFTTWKGEATIRGADGVATNAALHSQVLMALSAERRPGNSIHV